MVLAHLAGGQHREDRVRPAGLARLFPASIITAWQASAVDNLAGGRLRLGLGAGWHEEEHEAFGFDLLDTDSRFARFEEGLEVVTRLLRSEEPVSFDGEFYRLRDALILPRSPRPGGVPDRHRRQRRAQDAAARGPLRRRVERRLPDAGRVRGPRFSSGRAGARGRTGARGGTEDPDDAGRIRPHPGRRRPQARRRRRGIGSPRRSSPVRRTRSSSGSDVSPRPAYSG